MLLAARPPDGGGADNAYNSAVAIGSTQRESNWLLSLVCVGCQLDTSSEDQDLYGLLFMNLCVEGEAIMDATADGE